MLQCIKHNMCVCDVCNVYSFHRTEKELDPTIFTTNSTTLEASVCQLKLPEVRLPQHFDLFIWGLRRWLRCKYVVHYLSSNVSPTPRVPLQDAGGFYNIDNEEYDAMPVEVRLLPRKLRFFINATRREQLLTQAQWGGTLTLGGAEQWSKARETTTLCLRWASAWIPHNMFFFGSVKLIAPKMFVIQCNQLLKKYLRIKGPSFCFCKNDICCKYLSHFQISQFSDLKLKIVHLLRFSHTLCTFTLFSQYKRLENTCIQEKVYCFTMAVPWNWLEIKWLKRWDLHVQCQCLLVLFHISFKSV